jgi:hypothetical protein
MPEYNFSYLDGSTRWEIVLSEKWREMEKKIFTDPVNVDITDQRPVDYKYFDRFRELAMEYKQNSNKEGFQQKLALIRADLQKDSSDEANAIIAYTERQNDIRKSDEYCKTLAKGKFVSEHEALEIALHCISALRGEAVTEKTVLQKLNAMSTTKSTTSPQK